MAPKTLPAWPPALTDEQRAHLVLLSTTWAYAHGLTYLPVNPTTPPTGSISAPLSLFPTPFPRDLFTLAREIQPIYNALYARIALDWAFLDKVMGGSVASVDEFQGELWRGWKSVRNTLVQPLQLGIFRSDYLLHQSKTGGDLEIKQVEFNTISASFGCLSQRAGELHKYLTQATQAYWGIDATLSEKENLPVNKSLKTLAGGLAASWKAYGNPDAAVLFVVQTGERNVFDQRWLEYELLESHGIRVVWQTFTELAQSGQVDSVSKKLVIPTKVGASPTEIAVIYYRSAYTPDDYLSPTEWETRVRLETSAAIKCPSMALQLAGAKKIQQVLAEPGVLEDFLLGEERPDVGFGKGAGSLTREDVGRLRKTWIGLWPLDDSPLGREAVKYATEESHRFVLKPQREGGGNNIYRGDIPPALEELAKSPRKEGEPDKKEGYILMELIEPPQGVSNWLLRGGEKEPRKADVVSELGIYGVSLFGGEPGLVVNREAGFLLRTKGRESDEGGVAIGISSIDSPLLVD